MINKKIKVLKNLQQRYFLRNAIVQKLFNQTIRQLM